MANTEQPISSNTWGVRKRRTQHFTLGMGRLNKILVYFQLFLSLLQCQMMTSILQMTSFGKWAILKGAHWWKTNFFVKVSSKKEIGIWSWSNPWCFPKEKMKVPNSHALAYQCVHCEIVTKLKHSHLEKVMVTIKSFAQNRKRLNQILHRPKGLQGEPGTMLEVCPYFSVMFFSWNPPPAIDLIQIITEKGFCLSFSFFFFFNKFN